MKTPYDPQAIAKPLEEAAYTIGRFDQNRILELCQFQEVLLAREAVLSNRIEGYECRVEQMLEYRLNPDARILAGEVSSNGLDALHFCVEQSRLGETPTHQIIYRMHQLQMKYNPGIPVGKYRECKVRIGNHTPPPADQVKPQMDELLEYIQTTQNPYLIRACIAHAWYEMIHPFPDGNGRSGRALLSMLTGIRRPDDKFQPAWSSAYFWTERQKYYLALQTIQETGDFTEFLKTCLKAVAQGVLANLALVLHLEGLHQSHQERLGTPTTKNKNALRLLEHLKNHPVTNTEQARIQLEMSPSTLSRALSMLKESDIATHQTISGKSQKIKYIYHTAAIGLISQFCYD